MNKFSIDALARELGRKAGGASSGRAADTVYGGHERVLRQTVIALNEGSSLSEHDNPGEATVLVLNGRVELTSGTTTWQGSRGDLLVVPNARHSLTATTTAAVLLTVATVGPR